MAGKRRGPTAMSGGNSERRTGAGTPGPGTLSGAGGSLATHGGRKKSSSKPQVTNTKRKVA